jgi:mannosyltransferase
MSSHGETMDVTVSRPDALAAGGTTDARGSRDRRRLALVAAVAGGVSAVVSVTGSWIPSLWGDEAASLLSAQRSFGSLFTMLGHVDAVHGFYYVLLHLWVNVAGTSPFAIRLPSAVAVGVAAAAVAWTCGRMRSLRLAILAGVVAAILPRLTYAGEEARAYAFDAALCAVLCAIVAEIALRQRPGRRLWVAYAAVLTIATYMFLYDLLMSVAVGAFLLATPGARRRLRAWAIATGTATVIASPLLVFAALERSQVAYLAHRDEVTGGSVFEQMWFGSVPFALVAWACILIAGADLVVRAVRRRRAGGTLRNRRPEVVVLALCWLVLPAGILIGSSPLVAGFTARYATMAAPAAAVLIAAGIDRVAHRTWMAVAAAGVVVAVALPVWAAQRGPYAMNESDWNEIATTVHAHARHGDGVVFDEGVRPSRRTRLAMDTDPAAFSGLKDVTLRSPYPDNPTWHDTTYSVSAAASLGRFHGVSRVWLIEYALPGHADDWGVEALKRLGYHLTAHYEEHRSLTYLFTR